MNGRHYNICVRHYNIFVRWILAMSFVPDGDGEEFALDTSTNDTSTNEPRGLL